VSHVITKKTGVLFDLTKRIGESEGVIMTWNFDDVWKSSTFAVNQELTDTT
jgi:hypothetical protein